jgi:molybdopterin converting factor small subunit
MFSGTLNKRLVSDMAIQVRVIGAFLERPLNKSFDEPFTTNDTLQSVFVRLDKRKTLGRKFFSRIIKQGQVTLLLNGDRLDLPEDMKRPLRDGDEISILSAIAGG